MRRAGRRLRITAQLVDARTDHHLWADKYDGDVEDVFAFQERLARVIVDALKLELSADEQRRLGEHPIASLPAYECYLRARQEGWRWRKDAIDRAVKLLRDGLAIVGENAGLYAALGLAYLQYREAGIDFGDGPLREAEICGRKVLALAPDSSSGRQLQGWIHYSRGRIQEAVRDLKAALAIDPNRADTLLLLSNCYLISGRVAAARPLIDRLLAVDPLTPVTRCLPGYADALEGHVAAAVEPYRQMFEMDPGNPMGRLFYVWALAANRRLPDVEAIVTGFPPETGTACPRAWRGSWGTPWRESAERPARPSPPRSRGSPPRPTCSRGCSPRATRWREFPSPRCIGSRSPSSAGSSTTRSSRATTPFWRVSAGTRGSRSSWPPCARGGSDSKPESPVSMSTGSIPGAGEQVTSAHRRRGRGRATAGCARAGGPTPCPCGRTDPEGARARTAACELFPRRREWPARRAGRRGARPPAEAG